MAGGTPAIRMAGWKPAFPDWERGRLARLKMAGLRRPSEWQAGSLRYEQRGNYGQF
jgi:hypothetical protein